MYNVLGAALVAGLITILLTPALIKVLRRLGVGQRIREDGPQAHFSKAGTPTMGGVLIVLGTTIGYLVMSQRTPDGLLVMGTMIACGLLGFLDDFIKIRKKRSLGLKPWYKILGQVMIAFGFAMVATRVCGLPPKLSFIGEIGVSMSWLFFVWIFIMIIGTSNAVNLTDGLDGLAAGAVLMVMAAYMLIAFTMFRRPELYEYFSGAPALDIAIICGAVLGACVGFLWWNAAPARLFMGDTGSLALGGVLAAVALMTRTQLLLLVLGGLFVLEALSVIIQVGVFKITGGKRVFRMAPIHHHFELKGWSEFTVMVRLWIICGFCVLVGFTMFYADFVHMSPGP